MKKLTILIVFTILTVIFSGCVPEISEIPRTEEQKEDPAAQSSREDAKRPGTEITIGCGADMTWNTLDPVYEDGSISGLIPLAFEGLVKTGMNRGGSAVIESCLAESWIIGSDGLKYTFNLKPDVKFADGTPVTVEDWIWSLNRTRGTKESPWAVYAAPIKSITAPDDETLVIELTDITPSFLSLLTLSSFSVQSRRAEDRTNKNSESAYPVGTGAFFFSGKIDGGFEMARNPFYHVEIESNADWLLFKSIKDDNERIRQLYTGELDIVLNPPPGIVAHLEADGSFIMNAQPSTEQRTVNFNVTKAPLDSAKVRRALRMATDKDEIIETALFGCGEAAYNIFTESGLYYNPGVYDEGYDIDKAIALLSEAGFPDGFETEISFTLGNSVAEGVASKLKDQWAKIGVKLELAPIVGDALNERLDALDYGVTLLRWSDDTCDPANFAGFVGRYDISRGFHTGYENPRVGELVWEAASTVDPEKRRAAYYEMQQILYHEAPFYPIYRTNYITAVRNNISGFEQTAFGEYIFKNLRKN